MEKEDIAVGLDIGTTKIVAMIAKKECTRWSYGWNGLGVAEEGVSALITQ
jgi:cell division ATPase FtsA